MALARQASLLIGFLFLVAGCDSGSSGGGGANSAQGAGFGIIFVSNTLVNGSGAAVSGGFANGLPAMDAVCATDAAAKGLGGVYKAILGKWNEREPLVDGWVLIANTEYRREDRTTLIGITNHEARFMFPLANSFASSTAYPWTGLLHDQAADFSNSGGAGSCQGWTTNSSSFSGNLGNTSTTAMDGGTNSSPVYDNTDWTHTSCDNMHPILCAQQ